MLTKREAAELAGYSVLKDVRRRHQNLTNPRHSPLVVKYISELKIEEMLKYGVTYESTLQNLA